MRALQTTAGLPLALLLLLLSLPGCGGCTPPASQAAARPDRASAARPESPDKARPDAPATPPARSDARKARPDVDRGTVARAGISAGAKDDVAEPAPTAASPEAALSSARELHAAADRKSDDGDQQGAFADASRAYGLVRQFPDHGECRDLADDLLRELETLETRADVGAGTATPESRRLILK